MGASKTAGPSDVSCTLSSASRRVGRRSGRRREGEEDEEKESLAMAVLFLTEGRGGASQCEESGTRKPVRNFCTTQHKKENNAARADVLIEIHTSVAVLAPGTLCVEFNHVLFCMQYHETF